MERNDREVTPEIRRKALEILHSGRRDAEQEVEKLLGWDPPFGMPYKKMALRLGITYYQLRYLIQRGYLQERAKKEETFKRDANKMTGSVVGSQKLGFCIWLPDGWLVSSENIEVEDVSEGAQLMNNLQQKHISADEAYRRLVDGERAKVIGIGEFRKLYEQDRKTAYRAFFEGLLGTPGDEGLEELASRDFSADEAYRRLMADPETFVIDFATFKEQYEEENQRWQSKLQLKKKQGSQIGYWRAEPKEKGKNDPLEIEVIKFRFREPMTSLQLYYAEKPDILDVSRPTSRKDLMVDGIEAVKVYYRYPDMWRGHERIPGNAQFTTYLTDGLVGWTFDCWITQDDTYRLRPLFHRIVNSFHRV